MLYTGGSLTQLHTNKELSWQLTVKCFAQGYTDKWQEEAGIDHMTFQLQDNYLLSPKYVKPGVLEFHATDLYSLEKIFLDVNYFP